MNAFGRFLARRKAVRRFREDQRTVEKARELLADPEGQETISKVAHLLGRTDASVRLLLARVSSIEEGLNMHAELEAAKQNRGKEN